MVATDKLFAGSIPEVYDRFLVPLIFEPYAADLAARVGTAQPRDVLEIAAGTGVLNVTAPPNGNIAPPGYYMLFIVDANGVPSVAPFVQVSSNPANQPPRVGAANNASTNCAQRSRFI